VFFANPVHFQSRQHLRHEYLRAENTIEKGSMTNAKLCAVKERVFPFAKVRFGDGARA
jgi:hypothetical protein